MENSEITHNVIIIGGGPAGLAAGLYTGRASLNPLIFAGSPPGGQLMLTSHVENYPGFESILGPELIEMQRKHVAKFGATILDQNIKRIDLSSRPFTLEAESGIYKAKSVIITTGASALWLNLPSEQKLRGHGVSACATCDGFFFKNVPVAVVGGGDTAMEEALTLTKFASHVYVIHRRDSFRASKIMIDRVTAHEKITVMWNSEVDEVLGEQKVDGLKIKNLKENTSSNLQVSGLFLAIGHKPDTEIFKGQISLDSRGYVVTSGRFAHEYTKQSLKASQKEIELFLDASTLDSLKDKFDLKWIYGTNVDGVFAAGDCVDFDYRQAGTAAGMGIAAALEVERWLETHE